MAQSPTAHSLSLATAAARQQQQRGAKMINNNWQVLGVGLMAGLPLSSHDQIP